MAHYCKYFIVHCIDFRFGRAIKDYLEKEEMLGDCDIVSVAGGVKDTGLILGQLEISLKLHNVQEAVLIGHIDCGAYGGSGEFVSFEQEREFQLGELKKARDMILAKYPSLKARMALAKIEPSGEVIFEGINA